MTILVTGGGGFIGRGIVRALVDRGEAVRVFCRGDYPELRDWGVELHRGDLRDAGAVNAAVRGCAGVFHVAALFELWGDYQDFFATNVEGTRHVLQACRAHGTRKIVYTSTPSVVHGGASVDGVDESAPYPERFEAHYPATKAIAEQEVLAANGTELSSVAIRPHLVWGPGDTSALPRLIARAKAGRLRLVGVPRQIDTTYIDNAVSAHLSAYDRLSPSSPVAGRAYFITQGEPLPAPQFVNDMLEAAGLPPVTRTVPAALARGAATMAEALWTLLRLDSEPPVTRYVVSQLSTAHWYDISAARRDLGYTPAVTYAEGMVRLKAWARQAVP
jgi:nucleoside-diphosphate-sugar epimerase